MTRHPRLGVCYYPEHWPEAMWARDAARMAETGISQVRIGEFAWSRIEPTPGSFTWDWLDRAIDTLGAAGLDVMLGTPTATPPKWLIDAHPDILAVDADGHPRKFGSRRHYCFSSQVYREKAARITGAVAARYGTHAAITSWQTDNEYGCHNTVRSYSHEAARAFRVWLADRYADIAALNEAWGCVFWSQDYRSFDEIDLPNLTVTEPNPSHVLDFYRFSSDQVVHFNRLQTDIIRRHSRGRDIVHNYMGFYYEFDHFKVSEDLDAVGWDSYPIGFLDSFPFPAADKERYMRQGHPDIAAFHHDLYRACGRGRWQILEQQPGPVNWAANNPAPLPGMARLWALEGFAHGAEVVSYFRWRQAPFAQEQMHAGLERPDGEPAPAMAEARTVASELEQLGETQPHSARIGLVFDYEATWLFEAHPQGAGWSYPALAFQWYSAARRLGFDIDIVPPNGDFSPYDIVLVPSAPVLDQSWIERLRSSKAQFLFGPRTGSKTQSLTIPDNLAPGLLQELLPVKVSHSESFPDFYRVTGQYHGVAVTGRVWLDHAETTLVPEASSEEGGLLYRGDNIRLLMTVPDDEFLTMILRDMTKAAGLTTVSLPDGLRMRRLGDFTFVFNYAPASQKIADGIVPTDAVFVIGDEEIPAAGIAAWRMR